MLWLGLVSLAAVLEVAEAEEVFPGSSQMVVSELIGALARQSGCAFESRTCEVGGCGPKAEGSVSGPVVRLYLVGGIQRLHISLEGTAAPGPIEDLWPIELESWPGRAAHLALRAFPTPICAAVPTATTLSSTTDPSTPSILPAALAVVSVAAFSAGIGFHILAGQSRSEAELSREWQPEVEDLWRDAEFETTVGHVLLSSAIGLAGLAILTELIAD